MGTARHAAYHSLNMPSSDRALLLRPKLGSTLTCSNVTRPSHVHQCIIRPDHCMTHCSMTMTAVHGLQYGNKQYRADSWLLASQEHATSGGVSELEVRRSRTCMGNLLSLTACLLRCRQQRGRNMLRQGVSVSMVSGAAGSATRPTGASTEA